MKSNTSQLDNKPKPPVIVAERVGSQLKFWCSHCRHYHLHGGSAGHRVDHCFRPGSPYDRIGYELVVAPGQGVSGE